VVSKRAKQQDYFGKYKELEGVYDGIGDVALLPLC